MLLNTVELFNTSHFTLKEEEGAIIPLAITRFGALFFSNIKLPVVPINTQSGYIFFCCPRKVSAFSECIRSHKYVLASSKQAVPWWLMVHATINIHAVMQSCVPDLSIWYHDICVSVYLEQCIWNVYVLIYTVFFQRKWFYSIIACRYQKCTFEFSFGKH